MTLFDEYDGLAAKYKLEYGDDNVVVLYEVGSFFEIYGCEDGKRGCNVKAICGLLNLQATKKNKNIPDVSASNPELGGFPSAALPKYLPVLMSSGYTVVIATQTSAAGGGDTIIQRIVTKVASRGTWIDEAPGAGAQSQHLLCMFFETTAASKQLHGCGVALMDATTGRSHAFQTYSADHVDVVNSMCAKIAGFDVCEALLVGDEFAGIEDVLAHLQSAGINRRMVHNRLGVKHVFDVPAYQNSVISKTYTNTGLLSPAEFVGMERQHLALSAFVAMLDFAYKHDETLVVGLPPPLLRTSAAFEAVQMSPSTLRNLDVLPASAEDRLATASCLSSLLNRCVTTPGRRRFKERMMAPITDPEELEKRFDATEALGRDFKQVRQALRDGACDVDRVWRRLAMRTGFIKEVPLLRKVARTMDALAAAFPTLVEIVSRCATSELRDAVETVLDATQAIDDDGLIRPGVFADLDAARDRVGAYAAMKAAWVDSLKSTLDGFRKGSADWVKLAATDEPCAHVVCTAKRFEVIAAAVEGVDVIEQGKNSVKFTHASLRNAANDNTEARAALDALALAKAKELQLALCGERVANAMRAISNAMVELDIHSTLAKDAAEHAMVRPRIVVRGDGDSTLACRGLRHPLVERVSQGVAYVPNDVCFDGETIGMLLFGVNAAGKSSLSKAIAISVLMAQAGMFVACSDMTLTPFTAIYTRMASRDNIYRGKSTFMVELGELRDILNHADDRSLVVGDELCSGTESASAISIVGAACLSLVKRRCCFVFATHLHELPRVKHVVAQPQIKVFHLGVTYDRGGDRLIYQRQLLPGPGKALYGLEVARAMHLGADFMSVAQDIRRELLGIQHDVLSTKTSHFNRKLFVDVCSVCKEATATETHHVAPQRLADGRGLISHFRKNALHNLVPLCGKCHDAVHSGKVHIAPAMQTTHGISFEVGL